MIKNFQSFEAIKWYSKGKLTLDPDYDDDQFNDTKLQIIAVYNFGIGKIDYNSFYLLDDNKKIYDNYSIGSSKYKILSEEELQEYIYSDKRTIFVYEGKEFSRYCWSGLPDKIKSRL